MNTTQIAKINNVEIAVIEENGEKFIPVRTICDVLGINADTQIEKIKKDEVLFSTTPLRGVVGAHDGGKNKIGKRVIKYVKRINGTIIYLEEVRTNRKELCLNTMYIKKAH
jgi:hypothetical protein